MSRYCGDDRDPEPILKAAAHWRDVALLGQGSVFGAGQLWTVDNLKAIDQYFTQNLDTGTGKFLQKLEAQLAPCPVAVKQLAAEIMWFLFLGPSNVSPNTKRSRINTIWAWSKQPLPANDFLSDDVLTGIGSGGPGFNNHRWREVAFCNNFVMAFKALSAAEQRRLIASADAFSEWLQSVPDADSRQLRHMVLYLLFPDDFERIFSAGDRLEVAAKFAGMPIAELKSKTAHEVDFVLKQCRAKVEAEYKTKSLDFYLDPLNDLWGEDVNEKLKKILRKHVEAAIARIDEDGIPPGDRSKKFDILFQGKRYPLKLVVSIAAEEATGSSLKANTFASGEGGPAYKKIEDLGFEIVEKKRISKLMDAFLAQASGGTDLTVKQYEKDYRGLKIKVSFGQGGIARVPWIAFLAPDQKASEGIYPVILYYREAKLLVLAYGVSEENDAGSSWQGIGNKPTIDEFLESQHAREPERYGESFVEATYDLNSKVDMADLTRRLDLMIDLYRKQAGGVGHSETSQRDQARSENDMPPPTNLIYYGPPGTGKTYKTAEKAVLLCDGKLPDGGRAKLMERYRELVDRQRINFVTFHQSYSYEDFVEGLRPDVDGDGSAKQGIKLSIKPGVFKAIADRAAADRGTTSHDAVGVEGRGAFKMSLGRSADDDDAYLFQDAVKNDYVLLGYGGDIDWSDDRYVKFSAILSKWQERDPTATGNNPNVTQIFTLRNDMKEGDFVIISDGNKRFRAIGLIAGPYKFVKRERDVYHHQRKVEWLWVRPSGLPREEIYGKHFSQVSAYRLVSEFVKWNALAQFIAGGGAGDGDKSPQPFVLIIDEINRGNISKIFGELITLIEPDKRSGSVEVITVKLPYSYSDFSVPNNLHIIGTMNTADRSIALLDTALRRRFEFEELAPMAELISNNVEGVDLRAAFNGINSRIEYLYDRDHLIGHAYLQKCKTVAQLNEVMGKRIIPLLVEYFHENWEKVRAVLKETKNDGAFIRRELLTMSAIGDDDGSASQDRWRYSINPTFDAADYGQLK